MSQNSDFRKYIAGLQSNFSSPKRLAIIGSLSFSNPHTETVCNAIGRQLAMFTDLIVITGGVSGIPEAVSRHVWHHRQTVSTGGASVYHVQPRGFEAWDYGENITAGQTMEARRRILAALAPLYLLLEGGRGAEQEAGWALRQGALLIPVGFTGGAARSLFDQLNAIAMKSLPFAQQQAWITLKDYRSNPEEIATAVAILVKGAMETKGYPLEPVITADAIATTPTTDRTLSISKQQPESDLEDKVFEQPEQQKFNLLLLHHSIIRREYFQLLFQRAGYNLTPFTNTVNAWEYLQGTLQECHLILCELGMLNHRISMDLRLKQNARLSSIPVVEIGSTGCRREWGGNWVAIAPGIWQGTADPSKLIVDWEVDPQCNRALLAVTERLMRRQSLERLDFDAIPDHLCTSTGLFEGMDIETH